MIFTISSAFCKIARAGTIRASYAFSGKAEKLLGNSTGNTSTPEATELGSETDAVRSECDSRRISLLAENYGEDEKKRPDTAIPVRRDCQGLENGGLVKPRVEYVSVSGPAGNYESIVA
jgi:hypothetical protein